MERGKCLPLDKNKIILMYCMLQIFQDFCVFCKSLHLVLHKVFGMAT